MSEKILTKDEILAAEDLKTQRLSVPEWGGDVFIKLMTGSERDAYETWAVQSKETSVHIRGKLVALCLIDETGERLFSHSDIVALGKKSAAALERVCTAVQTLNAITQDDIKELEKN